jgi:hypothetical protein
MGRQTPMLRQTLKPAPSGAAEKPLTHPGLKPSRGRSFWSKNLMLESESQNETPD